MRLEMIPPRLERVSPLPLPVALLPPLGPGEAALSRPVGLVILVAVGLGLGYGEYPVGENLLQLADEERLEAAAGLSHLRIGLRSHRDKTRVHSAGCKVFSFPARYEIKKKKKNLRS